MPRTKTKERRDAPAMLNVESSESHQLFLLSPSQVPSLEEHLEGFQLNLGVESESKMSMDRAKGTAPP